MTNKTLKRMMELAGVDMNSPKVTMLVESDQQVTMLVQKLEDDIIEYVQEHGGPSNDEEGLAWSPPEWKNGTEIWREMQHSVPAVRATAIELEDLIGHEKTLRLATDIANSAFEESQQG